jgi:hypothetical protein
MNGHRPASRRTFACLLRPFPAEAERLRGAGCYHPVTKEDRHAPLRAQQESREFDGSCSEDGCAGGGR